MAKKNKMNAHGECCSGHKKAMGLTMLILGLLILANSYWAVVNWAVFIGAIIAIKGFLKLVIPMHSCK